MTLLILETSVASLVALALTVYSLYRLISKKGFLPPPGKGGYPEIREWRDKNRKSINIITTILLAVILIPANFIVTVPYLRDVKYVVSNNYPEFEGEIISEVHKVKGRAKRQEVVIQSETQVLEISVDIGIKQKGERIRIKYLPHLNIGAMY